MISGEESSPLPKPRPPQTRHLCAVGPGLTRDRLALSSPLLLSVSVQPRPIVSRLRQGGCNATNLTSPKQGVQASGGVVRCPTCGKSSWSPQPHPVIKKRASPPFVACYWYWKYRHPRKYTGKDPQTGLPRVSRSIWSCFVEMSLEEITRLRENKANQPSGIQKALGYGLAVKNQVNHACMLSNRASVSERSVQSLEDELGLTRSNGRGQFENCPLMK